MIDIIKQIKGELILFEGMYDIIRVINPTGNKTIIFTDNRKTTMGGTCYEYWGKELFCSNCVSMRAFLEKDIFIKIEYCEDKVILIIATPVNIEGTTYIVEMLKDISKNGRIIDNISTQVYNLGGFINELNDNVIKTALTAIYNGRYLNERLSVDKNIEELLENTTCIESNSKPLEYQLSVLNRKIEELRDSLNEICVCSDEVNNTTLKLNVSKYLDELIVDYMKKNMTFQKQ